MQSLFAFSADVLLRNYTTYTASYLQHKHSGRGEKIFDPSAEHLNSGKVELHLQQS